jgi:hypothetical protein
MASENQTQNVENINIELVKNFERKYNAKLAMDKVAEIQYLPKWSLKELIREAMEYAATTERVVRILGAYFLLPFGSFMHLAISPTTTHTRQYIKHTQDSI